MGQFEAIDPAAALNRRARTEGWPFTCDSELRFERPELGALRDAWRAIADAKGVPSRADFDARAMKPFLRHIAIVERVFVDPAKWRYRTRLCGSAIVEVTGEKTGRFLDEDLPRQFLTRWTLAYDTVLGVRAPLRFVVDFELPVLAYLGGESLVAPLAGSRGDVNLVLSCVFFRPKRGVA